MTSESTNTRDKPKAADAAPTTEHGGGFQFEGYTPDRAVAVVGQTKDVLPGMGDQLKSLQMAQLDAPAKKPDASQDGADKWGQPEKPVFNPILDVHNRGASPAFAQEVSNSIATLPGKVAQELKDRGVQVNVFKNIYEYDKAMGTHKAKETVNGHNAALDGPSLYDGKGKPPNIAIFEQLGDGTPVKSLSNTDIGGLARHEAGHAFSQGRGWLTMKDANFQAAMGKDVDNLTNAQTQQLMKEVKPGGPMNYYLGSPAKEEFYAEAFATATGKGSDKFAERRIKELFPNVIQYMKDSTRSK